MMLLALIMGIFSFSGTAHADVDVVFLTQTSTLKLKTWTATDLKSLAKHAGQLDAQKLIFDESTEKLELNDRADIDLVTIYGSNRTTRVPRFMIWRGILKLQMDHDGSLNAKGEGSRLMLPSTMFSISKITKIELSRASMQFPENELHLKTNPAASRGEKLFSQNCLACHGLNLAKLKVDTITDAQIKSFDAKHRSEGVSLDARAVRGLIAYRDALTIEHSEVKSKK
jgi:hypothetical protein